MLFNLAVRRKFYSIIATTILLTLFGCSEPTDVSNDRNRAKVISNLSLLRSISRRPPALNKTFRNENDPMQMLNLGQGGSIKLTKNSENNFTFDYTGLGIGDELAYTNSSLFALYFPNNINYTEQHRNAVHPASSNYDKDSFMWTLQSTQSASIIQSDALTEDIFKYSADLPDFKTDIERVTVVLNYMPLNDPHLFVYTYKGLSNGTGELEIVGYQIRRQNDGQLLEAVGDNNSRTPYVPSGY